MYTNILNVQLAFPVTDPLFLCSVCWSLFGAFSLSYLSFVCFTLVIILGTLCTPHFNPLQSSHCLLLHISLKTQQSK